MVRLSMARLDRVFRGLTFAVLVSALALAAPAISRAATPDPITDCFSDDMARPAFTQDLTYDLADGDEIGFRGARIKVLKATNTAITYVVLKPLAAE